MHSFRKQRSPFTHAQARNRITTKPLKNHARLFLPRGQRLKLFCLCPLLLHLSLSALSVPFLPFASRAEREPLPNLPTAHTPQQYRSPTLRFTERCLAIEAMKNTIARGRCNASRKRNKERAAAGITSGGPITPQDDVLFSKKRAWPQALPDEEVVRMFNMKRLRRRLRRTQASGRGESADEAPKMVLGFCGCHPRSG